VPEQLSIKQKLEALKDFGMTDGLGEWEQTFVDSNAAFMEQVSWDTRRLTSKQVEKIDELYERRIVRGLANERRFHERKNKA